MTARELAYAIYAHFGIPKRDWPKHYDIDCSRSRLRFKAMRTYQMILRSLDWR